jgi:hypothetical protein
MIASLRSIVCCSGYLETLPKGKQNFGSDASHAWVSVYVPEMGVNLILQTILYLVSVTSLPLMVAITRYFSFKGIIFSSGEHKVKLKLM